MTQHYLCCHLVFIYRTALLQCQVHRAWFSQCVQYYIYMEILTQVH